MNDGTKKVILILTYNDTEKENHDHCSVSLVHPLWESCCGLLFTTCSTFSSPSSFVHHGWAEVTLKKKKDMSPFSLVFPAVGGFVASSVICWHIQLLFTCDDDMIWYTHHSLWHTNAVGADNGYFRPKETCWMPSDKSYVFYKSIDRAITMCNTGL